MVLAICTIIAGIVCLILISAQGFTVLLLLALVHAAMLAPTTTLADALALGGARSIKGTRFEYGWVRGAGSAAFILGSLIAGYLVSLVDFVAIAPFQALFLFVSASAALTIRELSGTAQAGQTDSPVEGVAELLKNRVFLCVVLAAASILGSHAMHDSFAMIAWNEAGIGPGIGSILWSESVAAEVVMFLFVGPLLLRYVSVEICIAISAIAAALRWIVMAQTTSVLALAAVEPLHGLSFALLHLSCMRLIVCVVPTSLAATAQAFYAWGIGVTSAMLTLLSGFLYASFGIRGFFVMAVLAAASLPVLWILHRERDGIAHSQLVR
jgi:PPP family 3-phenylpropionic acid transporter